jgi:hypothetical protein
MRAVVRVLRDETAITYTEYLITTLFLVISVLAASRTIVKGLNLYLRRIYLIVTLPIP